MTSNQSIVAGRWSLVAAHWSLTVAVVVGVGWGLRAQTLMTDSWPGGAEGLTDQCDQQVG